MSRRRRRRARPERTSTTEREAADLVGPAGADAALRNAPTRSTISRTAGTRSRSRSGCACTSSACRRPTSSLASADWAPAAGVAPGPAPPHPAVSAVFAHPPASGVRALRLPRQRAVRVRRVAVPVRGAGHRRGRDRVRAPPGPRARAWSGAGPDRDREQAARRCATASAGASAPATGTRCGARDDPRSGGAAGSPGRTRPPSCAQRSRSGANASRAAAPACAPASTCGSRSMNETSVGVP